MSARPKLLPRASLVAETITTVARTPDQLRALARWYRVFAEQAGNPVIWESRLLMAENLEAEAEHVESERAAAPRQARGRS